MRKAVISIFLVFMCWGQVNAQSMYGDAADADVKMKYVYTIEEALSRAKSENKLIFFNCFADWAIPCHSMNKKVFSDQEFADWMDQNFVNFFTDVTKGNGRMLAKKYNIATMAHYLILNSDGEVVHRIVGGSPIKEFKEQLSQALNPKTSLKGMNEIYEKGNRKVKFLRQYFSVLRLAEENEKAQIVLDELFSQLNKKEWSKKENWEYYLAKTQAPQDEFFNYLLDNRVLFEKSNGKEEVDKAISRVFNNNLMRFSAGRSSYDAEKLLDIFLIMKKADLPEEDMAFSFYDFAKKRLENDIQGLVDILNVQKDIWDPEVLRVIDLSLVLIKDMSSEDKRVLTNYWQERANSVTGSNRKHYLDSIKAFNITTGVKFEDLTFLQAIEKANSEDKLIFMDCYAVWCGPCKWLDNNTFVDEELGDYFNDNFINVKFNMEKGDGAMLAEKYDVKAFPTLLLLNKDEEVVLRITGALSAEDLLDKIRKI